MKSWLARHLPKFFLKEKTTPCPVCGRDTRSPYDRTLIDTFVVQFGFERDGQVLTHGSESLTLKGDCGACDSRTLGVWLGKRPGILPGG